MDLTRSMNCPTFWSVSASWSWCDAWPACHAQNNENENPNQPVICKLRAIQFNAQFHVGSNICTKHTHKWKSCTATDLAVRCQRVLVGFIHSFPSRRATDSEIRQSLSRFVKESINLGKSSMPVSQVSIHLLSQAQESLQIIWKLQYV